MGLACAVAVIGCGGSKVAPPDSYTVTTFNLLVASAAMSCFADGTASDVEGLQQAVDETIALARKDPDAVYEPSGGGEQQTMRQVLSDAATELDDCTDGYSAQLDRAAQTLDG